MLKCVLLIIWVSLMKNTVRRFRIAMFPISLIIARSVLLIICLLMGSVLMLLEMICIRIARILNKLRLIVLLRADREIWSGVCIVWMELLVRFASLGILLIRMIVCVMLMEKSRVSRKLKMI